MRKHVPVLLFFCALTPVMTYPLALHLTEAVPGPPWDNFVWLYDLWWFKHALFEAGVSPWFNPQMFYPFGYEVGLSETILASKALALPFMLLAGEITAFNSIVLASFALSGFTMYLWVLRLSGNRWAALVGGVIYAFAPYRIHALAAGWIPLLPTQWLPLSFLYLDRTLETRRTRPAALSALFAALSALSSWYYAYMLAIILPVYLLARARPWRTVLGDRRLWRSALVYLAVLVCLTVPILIPALGLTSSGWSLGYADRWSASLDDFVLPNVYHPLWGQFFLEQRADVPEYPWYAPGFVYLGLPALALAAVWFRQRRVAPLRGRATAPALAVGGIVSGVLALGTTLHAFGQRVYIPVPSAVEHAFSRIMIVLAGRLAFNPAVYSPLRAVDAIPIPLPALLGFLFLPLFSAMRHWYRFGVLTTLAIAVLAGLGAAVLLQRLAAQRNGARREALLGIFLIAVILLDFLPAPLPYGLSYANIEQPVDRWLAQQSADAVIMQFPLVRALNGPMLYRGVAHGKKMAYAHGTFYPPSYVEASKTLGQFPSAPSLDLMDSWGVRYIVVGSQAYDQGWGDLPGQSWGGMQKAIADSGRLRLIDVFEEKPFWRHESVSSVLHKELTPRPISADTVFVYELLR